MKSRDIVGKRIVELRQTVVRDPEYGTIVSIDSLILDDGSRVDFNCAPTTDLPVPIAKYRPRPATG